MQAVPLAALNGSVMAAFKSPSLSPPSAELAQTLGKVGSSSVYEISATTSPPMDSLSDMDDKCRLGPGEEMLSYTTQYYSMVETQSRASSPSTIMAASPKDSAGNLTPVSISSKETSSSEVLDDEGGDQDVLGHHSMCIPISSEGEQGPTATHVKHWTYEDQFKQLYNLSQDAERKEFLDKLFNFMQSKGTPITRVPIMAKQPLDLYKLFKLVVERGGLVEVIKKKAWRNVAKELNLPASITSAAFTMRSQYVKYLYPYECETVKLSEPQELQMAIDSNKRDRRHSDNMDFITPQLQRELDPNLSPVVTTATGLQLISSPTMAFPHASLPPYSGGFIVAGGPGGTHVVASPQLMQMASHVPGIPIMMPSPTIPVSTPTPSQAPPPTLSNHSQASSSEDKDDIQSYGSGDGMEPPAKRLALEGTHVKVTPTCNSRAGPYSIHQTSTGNFIMTHGGVVPSATPQLIQMGGPHMPIVLPTNSTVREQQKYSTSTLHMNGKGEINPVQSESMAVTALSSHPGPGAGVAVLSQRASPAGVGPTTHAARSLLQMAHHPNIPGLIIPQPIGPTSAVPQNGGDKRRKEQEKIAGTTTSNYSVKMPFANISIQPAATGSKVEGEEQNSVDASLVVTLEINNTVYQGVLFARPQSASSPQR